MNNLLWIAFIAMSPLVELRGAIPFGIALGYNPLLVLAVSVSANAAAVLFLFVFLHYFFEELFKIPVLGKWIHKTMDRVHKKEFPYIEKYGYIGLAVFVAMPLPFTGAWTGTLIAYLLEMERKKAMLAIAVGVFAAGIIVTAAVLGIIKIFIV